MIDGVAICPVRREFIKWTSLNMHERLFHGNDNLVFLDVTQLMKVRVMDFFGRNVLAVNEMIHLDRRTAVQPV